MGKRFSLAQYQQTRKMPRMATNPFSEREFNRWMADLPLGRVGETARLVYEKLGQLEAADIPSPTRWGALQRLLPILDEVTAALTVRFTTSGGAADTDQIVRLAASFHQRITRVAIQVAEQGLGPALALGARNRAQRAYELAIRHLGHRALVHYQYCTPPPASLWQELDRVFTWAGEMRASRETKRAYLALLALAAADPLQFTPSDLRVLYQSLLTLKLESFIRLQPGTAYHTNAWFIRPNAMLFTGDIPAGHAGTRVDLQDLANAWPAILQQKELLPQSLLAAPSGWNREARKDTRYAVDEAREVPMVIGFEAVVRVITDAAGIRSAALTHHESKGYELTANLGSVFRAERPPISVHVQEHSEGGYRLLLPAPDAGGQQPDDGPVKGDLIALAFEADHWLPGFVRWRRREAEGWVIGVVSPGRGAVPATVATDDGPVRAVQLSVPGGASAKTPAIVLFETRHVPRMKSDSSVSVEGQRYPMVLTEELGRRGNSAVVTYGLKPAPIKAARPDTPTVEKSPPVDPPVDQFSSVWGVL